MIYVSHLPMSDSSVMSSTNMQWSPTPYRKGIMHTFEISMSLDTHNPSISLLPLKKVDPVHVPVWCKTASRSPRLEVLAKALPNGPLYVCSL
jgi:hypothetical protein